MVTFTLSLTVSEIRYSLRTYSIPLQRIRFTEATGGISRDKLEQERTSQITEKDLGNRKH